MAGYDDLLMEHIKGVRNFRAMPDADARVEALNRLCGDRLELFLKWDGERAGDLSFQCECCGISMASSSILTETLRGLTRREILAACDRFVGCIADKAADIEAMDATPAQRALLEVARKHPSRTECAVLAWRSLRDALQPSGGVDSRGRSLAAKA